MNCSMLFVLVGCHHCDQSQIATTQPQIDAHTDMSEQWACRPDIRALLPPCNPLHADHGVTYRESERTHVIAAGCCRVHVINAWMLSVRRELMMPRG